MIGPSVIVQQPIDDCRPTSLRTVLQKCVDFGFCRSDSNRVERHPAQKCKVISELSRLEVLHIELRPNCSAVDPVLEQSDFFGRKRSSFGRHPDVFVFRRHVSDQGTLVGLAGNDGRSFGFTAVKNRYVVINAQSASGFSALVAVVAATLQQRSNVLEVVDFGLLTLFRIAGNGGDPRRDKAVDFIVCRVTIRQFGNRDRFCFCQPVGGDRAAPVPVLAVGFAAFRSGGGKDRPAIVVIGDVAFSRRKQRPVLAAFQRNRDNSFSEFRSLFQPAFDVPEHGFENHEVLAASRFKLAPGITISGWCETKVGTQVEVIVLDGQRRMATGIERSRSVLQQFLSVDEQSRQSPASQQQPVFSFRQFDNRRSSKVRRVRAIRADARGNVLVRNLKEAEHVFHPGFGDLRLCRPAIGLRHALLTDLHKDSSGGNHLARDGRRRRNVLVSFRDLVRVKAGTVDREIVEPSIERGAFGAGVAGSDNKVVGILNGRQIGRTALVPSPFGRPAVDPGLQAVGFSERELQRHVMPARGRHRAVAPPAVPRTLLRFRMLTGKQDAELSSTVTPEKSHGIILVVLRKVLAVFDVSSFADEISDLAFADRSEPDPGFETECVALSESHIRESAPFVIFDDKGCFMSRYRHGPIIRAKAGITWRTRTVVESSECAQPGSGLCLAIESPFEDRFGGDGEAGDRKNNGCDKCCRLHGSLVRIK